MRRSVHIFPAILIVSLLLSLCTVPTAAAQTTVVTDVVYFEDGSYLITELTTYPIARAAQTRTGSKTTYFANSAGTKQWSLTVNGTFTYNGSTSSATKATYSYSIFDSSWSLKSASAYCSGNQAIAEGTFSGGLFLSRSLTVTLSCSPSGVLS